jgi:pSer/pThr/pTyr-binding forkhead associated (FHA) protein
MRSVSLPFLLYGDGDGRPRLLELSAERPRVSIGRRASCDLALGWDNEVSRIHAELVRMSDDWVVFDDGLSHNGTFVNGDRVRGRRRLAIGDVIRIGATLISVCGPEAQTTAPPTRAARDARAEVPLTPAQLRLLESLSRPLRESAYAAPASNRQIAAELVLSVETVKWTLTALYERFELTGLPQNVKRATLAARALDVVSAGRR